MGSVRARSIRLNCPKLSCGEIVGAQQFVVLFSAGSVLLAGATGSQWLTEGAHTAAANLLSAAVGCSAVASKAGLMALRPALPRDPKSTCQPECFA